MLVPLVAILSALGLATGFKTGLEAGLICNQCVGTHPGQCQAARELIWDEM
jgi:hypothetical protein